MNKLKQKIAALLTVGIGIVPNVSFNVVKANNILQKDAFVENFQKKDITVYKTNDNLLVDANLNYINVDGKPLGKDDEKVSVSGELNDKIKLHPVLKYINDFGDDYKITKLQSDNGYASIFVKTARKDAEFKLLRFNPQSGAVDRSDILRDVDPDFVYNFGEALPKNVNEMSKSEARSLAIDLAYEAKNKNKENKIVTTNTSDDQYDSCIAAVVTGVIGLYIFRNLSDDGVVNLG